MSDGDVHSVGHSQTAQTVTLVLPMYKALTAVTIANLKPRALRYEIPDRGCRGLWLLVQPSGSKSWAVRYRFGGLTRKYTLGPVLLEPSQCDGVTAERAGR